MKAIVNIVLKIYLSFVTLAYNSRLLVAGLKLHEMIRFIIQVFCQLVLLVIVFVMCEA